MREVEFSAFRPATLYIKESPRNLIRDTPIAADGGIYFTIGCWDSFTYLTFILILLDF